ncbi:helix-turn-helix domain-containing protein [Brevibacillus fulvus]|uniref:Transcriptional regulator with XRE-family HTH domain n=1 Tax=Brevibacillus fulvus TaxID=1125967 RepID=A0A938XW92_9BACL|nr:helix-turn-helix transcriptional regulator [Brevibacillus fulvus]MBM7589269.1 transcriptional regulator with XRE-family HTH domain [Brevibacillus fulvus]
MKSNSWLVEIRMRKQLTQKEVANLAGIERSYYTKIENGAIPSVKVAKRIAEVLETNWTFFYE